MVRLSRGDTISDYVAAVEGRIRSLARAHALLAASRWDGADLSKLAEEELAAYSTGSDRIRISGPPLSLKPEVAQAIQLGLEYNPAPPFNAGSPDTAPAEILAMINERIAPARARRGDAVRRAADRLA